MRKTVFSGLSKLFAVWALALSVFIVAMPQVSAAQTATRYTQIIVRGNLRIEPASIRSFAALDLKKPITDGQLNGAYQRLVATGLFEEVTVTPRGARIIIEVQEYPTINRINIERNKRLKDEDLLALIGSQPRRTYNPAQAEADAAAIVEAYRLAGRFTAEVKPVIIRRADNRVDLVFEVFEGKVIEIQRLSFVGNRNFSDRRLRRVLGTKQAGILRRFVKSDTFIADRIEFDKQVLSDFYSSRGFIDFQVLSVASEVARARNGFFLTFKIREGQPYSFGELTTTSDLVEIDPDEFQDVVLVKPGVVFSPNHLDDTILRMEALATEKGLNFIRVNPRVRRNDNTRTLDIEFVIEKGPRVFVERIDIEGNTTTLDRVVRRQFKSVEGDPFNPREIRAATDRIRALGFFSTADVQTRQGSSGDRVIVDVNVEEQSTGSLSFAATYAGGSGIGGEISLSESNFLGRGQFIKVNLGGGDKNKSYEISFAEPSLFDRDLLVASSLYFRTSSQDSAFYDTSSLGFAPNVEFPISRNGRLGFNYLGAVDEVSNVDLANSSPIITGDAGRKSTSAFGVTYTFDNRSSELNPNAGTKIEVSQTIAGLGGDQKYSKTAASFEAKTAVSNEEVVLRAVLETGYLHSFGGSSRFTDRFYLNSDIMRGFASQGVGPRDLNATNLDSLGGNIFAVARFEATFPLGLPEEYGIAGGLFMDIGSVWSLDNTVGSGGFLVDDSMRLRAAVGFTVFWETPVGPLKFNFSRPIRRQSYDVSENFSISIGTRF